MSYDVSPQQDAPMNPPYDDAVWIPGGEFSMGSNEHYPEERPVRRVEVEGFWMDRTPVTTAAFREFVDATGYVTLAERPPRPEDYPDADPELLVPGSAVFVSPDEPVDLRNPGNWWQYVPGANWRQPLGPESERSEWLDHPVVHVAYEDAAAYAEWAGKRLPTEAEHERASRGGLDGATFAWGDKFAPEGELLANTWQGTFPWQNTEADGYLRTSPVGSFPANGYGVLDLIGNVWEWTDDWFSVQGVGSSPCCTPTTPREGTKAASVDPHDPARVPRKVLKGGSHLCAPNYCQRYRPAARYPEPVDTSTSHVGFRCVVSADAA